MGWRWFWRSPSTVVGAIVVGLAVLVALAAVAWGETGSTLTRLKLTQDPLLVDKDVKPPSAPDARHYLGTDDQGRDVLSRLLHGARVSLTVGFIAEAIAFALGLLVGVTAGYSGGRIDALLMRSADVLLAFPLPLLAMGAVAVFDSPSLTLVFMVLGLMGWGGIARLVRAEIQSLRRREFADAARALGARGVRIAFVHLLPNALAPALVAATVGVAGNILTESWLSFLGLGAQSPDLSWGRMILEGKLFLPAKPWLCIYPGIALAITVGGLMLLADGLRDRLDPRSRGGTWA